MAITIDVASDSALLSVAEKLERQNEILSGGTMTIKGDNAYICYSANADGADFTEEWSNNQRYVGFSTAQSMPTNKEDFVWVPFVGENGTTPHIGDNGNWYIGNTDTGVRAEALAEGATVVNVTGDSETAVMSQKATTDEFNKISTEEIVNPTNWLNWDECESGKFVSPSGGLEDNDGYTVTGYIPVEVGDTIRYQATAPYGVRFDLETTPNNGSLSHMALFDKDKNYIQGSYLGNAKTYTVNDDEAKYARISLNDNTRGYQGGYTEIAIIKGSTPMIIPYSEYFEPYCKRVPNTDNLPIVQTMGDSESAVMSQKAVSERFSQLMTLKHSKNLINPNDSNFLDGKYISANGATSDNEQYYVSGFIPVKEGDILYAAGYKDISIGTKLGFRMVAAYDVYGMPISASGSNTQVSTYTVPQGIAHVRLTVSKTTHPKTMVYANLDYIPPYEDYFEPYHIAKTDKTLSQENAIADAKEVGKRIEKISGKNPTLLVKADTLAANEVMDLSEQYPWYLKIGNEVAFTGWFEIFDKLSIGWKQNNSMYQGYLEIDATSITWYGYNVSTQSYYARHTESHGLNIDKYITVLLSSDKKTGCLSAKIQTDGQYYQWTNTLNGGHFEHTGKLQAASTTNMTNVVMSATNPLFKSDVWAIGDSYYGLSDTRVIGWLRDYGFTGDILINAEGGNNSSHAYNDLVRMLEFGVPKYLVYYIAMNDNTNLMSYRQAVEQLCEDNGIEMILNRTPISPLRIEENTYINNYVLSSGKRYIDSYTAVGSDDEGNWLSGYLSSDNVHPAKNGAMALASRLLIDVPEIRAAKEAAKE